MSLELFFQLYQEPWPGLAEPMLKEQLAWCLGAGHALKWDRGAKRAVLRWAAQRNLLAQAPNPRRFGLQVRARGVTRPLG